MNSLATMSTKAAQQTRSPTQKEPEKSTRYMCREEGDEGVGVLHRGEMLVEEDFGQRLAMALADSPLKSEETASLSSTSSSASSSGHNNNNNNLESSSVSDVSEASFEHDPDDSLAAYVLAKLSDEEKEIFGRADMVYEKMTEELAQKGLHPNAATLAMRDRLVVANFKRYLREGAHGNPEQALVQMRHSIQFFESIQFWELRHCFAHDTSEALELQRRVRKYNGLGRMFVRGYDKEGHAFMHVIHKNAPEHQKRGDHEGLIEANTYIFDKARMCSNRRMGSIEGSVNLSIDFNGFKRWHNPPAQLKDAFIMMNDHCPGFIHRAYLIDAPLIFRVLWKLVSPFLGHHLRERCVFVTGKEQRMEVFGEIMDVSEAMPYQHPLGQLTDPVDIEAMYALPHDVAYDERV